MRVQDIMTEGIKTIRPEDSADVAWNLMRQHGIHHLVVRNGRDLVGLLSARDLGGPRGAAVRRGQSVAQLMTPEVMSVIPTTTVRQAANLMRGRSIGSLIVGSKQRPVGIITVSDLLDALGRGDENSAVPTRRRVSTTAPRIGKVTSHRDRGR